MRGKGDHPASVVAAQQLPTRNLTHQRQNLPGRTEPQVSDLAVGLAVFKERSPAKGEGLGCIEVRETEPDVDQGIATLLVRDLQHRPTDAGPKLVKQGEGKPGYGPQNR